MSSIKYDLYEDDITNDECEFIDNEITGQVSAVNPILSYHLRVTGDKTKLKDLINDFVKHYKPSVYAFGYEEVDDNHHIHGHLEYLKVPTKQSLSQWMKVKGFSGLYYHQEVKKDAINNLLYVCKDLDILYHNLSDEYYKEIISKTKEINENKKMEQRHKLLMEYNKYISTYTEEDYKTTLFSLPALARWIMHHYINVYDKEPPLAHLKGYTIYIANKCDIKEKYQNAINNLFDNLF